MRVRVSETMPMPEPRHDPVMVDEILGALPLRPGALVVDGTLGLGGHSLRFLEKIAPGGTLVGLDWDESMLKTARERLRTSPPSPPLQDESLRERGSVHVELHHADFREIA